MWYTIDFMHALFPLLGVIFLILGLKTSHKNYILIALWISLIAIVLHYQMSGGEILGTYFNYYHTILYSLNLLILLIAMIHLLLSFGKKSSNHKLKYCMSLLASCFMMGVFLLLSNLWINAYFIGDRSPNTPVLQVASFKKLDYCGYHYVFYKVGNDGKVSYLCPNYYGLLPSMGTLNSAPDYVTKQLPPALQSKFGAHSNKSYV